MLQGLHQGSLRSEGHSRSACGLTDGLKTVGDAIDKIEETKAKIDKGLEDTNKLKSDLAALWNVVEASAQNGLTRETYESVCETLGKANIAGELMDMLHLTQDEISADYINGLNELMDKYSVLLEKETDWVQLVKQEMFSYSTPPELGIIVGVQTFFVVRADINITLGTNLEYEVGKRHNFWFRVGLFKPTSGSSTMDLIDEHFAFQFYVMGNLGIKTGVRLKLYAAIGSVDAISVGITTELGPYVKLWGFFIYDYSKYRPANTQNWIYKEQMAGALYLEFGLYLMAGMEAKALFLEYDHDFLDKEFPLLTAGDKIYYYSTAYEPIDDEDVIVVGWDNATTQQPGCVVSTLLPDEIRALKFIDLTTGKQGERILDLDQYIIKVSNPNFRVDVVDGHLVASVISIPENIRAMDCDLTITYKYGKMAFSTFDMSTTIHLTWSNLTSEERAQIYTACVAVPNGSGGMETIWRKRIRKGTPFNLPSDDEIKKLLSWNETKYAAGSGYSGQQTTDLTLILDTQYNYHVGYQTYELTVTGIEGGAGSQQTFTAKYGEKFDFSSLLDSGADSGGSFTRFAGLSVNGQNLDINKPVTGLFTQQVQSGRNAVAAARYVDDSATVTFEFSVSSGVTPPESITVTVRKGDTPSTDSVRAPAGLVITGFYPKVGPIESDTTYQVGCEAPVGKTTAVTVTFNANGGDAVPAITRTPGSVLGALPAPARTGYTWAEVKRKAGVLDELLKDLPDTMDWSKLYPIWQVKLFESMSSFQEAESYLEFSGGGYDYCLLYDLSTFYGSIIESISLANYGDNTNFNVTKAENLKIEIPSANEGRFNIDRTGSNWSRAPWKGSSENCFTWGSEATAWYSEHINEDTYYIGTAAEMANFSLRVYLDNSFEGKTIKLTADIDLSDLTYTTEHDDTFVYLWVPIGAELMEKSSNGANGIINSNYSKYFKGTFDGDGHTIKGMITENGGLFFGLGGNGVIKNLHLEDSFSRGDAGGLVTCMEDNARIESCTSTATVRNLITGKLYFRYFSDAVFRFTKTHTIEELCKELPEIRKSPYVRTFSN